MEIQNSEVENQRARFQKLYSVLKSELLQDLAFEHDSSSAQRVSKMLDYTVPGGKLNRGLLVVETYMLLKGINESFDDQIPEQIFLTSVLGWCIQWLVGCALVIDDVMDNSYTRRGRPCWFRLPNVGTAAVNDGILLWTHINLILKNHFRDRSYYVDLVHLFSEVKYQTASGEMLDLLTVEQDQSSFTSDLHTRISKYKTAYGTFYLPFACALLVLGENLEDYEDVKSLLLELGVYFQVQDDYLDCYGDPDEVGKIGTDIQDFKCSWLVVKALELCSEDQRKVLKDHYGKADEGSIAAVKRVYEELNLRGVYAEYETEIYEKLMSSIDGVSSKSVRAVLKAYLGKIYRRQK